MNTIEELIRILPPPMIAFEQPTELVLGECEVELINLPPDYKTFLKTYGTGCIDGFLWIFNPASANSNLNLTVQVKKQLSALEELFRQQNEAVVYRLFPDLGGLLPFGITDNGDVLFWKTVGNPKDWIVVVGHVRSPQYEEFRTDITGFLILLLTGLRVAAFPEDFPSASPSFAAKTR